MTTTNQEETPLTDSAAYREAVRSFDHVGIVAFPTYGRLRQALSDLGNEITENGGMELAAWLAAVRDMAVTAPYGDMCTPCADACRREGHDHGEDEFPRPCGAYRLWWPHADERTDEHIRGTYRCGQGHEWTCSYLISMAGLRGLSPPTGFARTRWKPLRRSAAACGCRTLAAASPGMPTRP